MDPQINLEQYDTLVIGTPIWAGTMTPPIHTFLHDNKIIGKTIILVTTCAGGTNEKAVEKMKEYLAGNFEIQNIVICSRRRKGLLWVMRPEEGFFDCDTLSLYKWKHE